MKNKNCSPASPEVLPQPACHQMDGSSGYDVVWEGTPDDSCPPESYVPWMATQTLSYFFFILLSLRKIIKNLTALRCCWVYSELWHRSQPLPARVICGAVSLTVRKVDFIAVYKVSLNVSVSYRRCTVEMCHNWQAALLSARLQCSLGSNFRSTPVDMVTRRIWLRL